MINISRAVKYVLDEDPIAVDAMARGYMNYSSYARLIRSLIKENLLQDVSEKSITVALSRIAKNMPKMKPQVQPKILNLSLHSDLAEISYEKTYANVDRIAKIGEIVPNDPKAFFASTRGVREITLIGRSDLIDKIEKSIKDVKPSDKRQNVTGITIKFPAEQLNTPGILAKLINQVSKQEINLIEILSTNTELTLLVHKKDAEAAVSQLSKLL